MSDPASSPSPPLGLREVLRLPPVRRLWLAQLVSVFGDFLALFAVLTYVSFDLHASPAQVTGITISFMLPFALIGPIAGVFVDRWNVRRTMIASDLARAAIVLLLVVANGLRPIYGLLFLMSSVSAFFVPAQSVALRTLVPAEGLMAANALMQQAMQFARIVSPALAGALASALGPASCYLADFASYLVSATLVAQLVIRREPKAAEPEAHPVRAVASDLRDGVRFVAGQPILSFAILAMAAGMFAVSCFAPLIAVYVRDELRSNPVVFGAVNAMIGVGMLSGTMMSGRLARGRSRASLIVLGLAVMGAFVLLLAAVKTVLAAAIGMWGVGVGVVLVFVSAQTMMQGQTPIDLVGRVSSSVWALISVAQLLGLVLSGATAQRIGVVRLFFASGAMLGAMAVLGWLALRRAVPAGSAAPAR